MYRHCRTCDGIVRSGPAAFAVPLFGVSVVALSTLLARHAWPCTCLFIRLFVCLFVCLFASIVDLLLCLLVLVRGVFWVSLSNGYSQYDACGAGETCQIPSCSALGIYPGVGGKGSGVMV